MSHTLLLLLLCCVAALRGDWLDGNDGVDRYGLDLPLMPLQLKNGSGARDCASLCNSNPECKAWALSKQDCDSAGQLPLCWLKATTPPQMKNKCRVSFYWPHPNHTHYLPELPMACSSRS